MTFDDNYDVMVQYLKKYGSLSIRYSPDGSGHEFCATRSCMCCKFKEQCDDYSSVERPIVTLKDITRVKNEYPEFFI